MKRKDTFIWGFKKVKKFLIPYFVFTLFSLLIRYIDSLEPVFSGKIIDYLIQFDKKAFFYSLFFLFILLLINLLLSLFIGWIKTKWNNHVTKSLELDFISNILSSSNRAAITKGNKEEVKNIILSDLSTSLSFYTQTIPNLIITLFTLLIIGYRLINIRLSLFFIVIALSFIPSLINIILSEALRKQRTDERNYQDNYLKLVNEVVDGKREIAINGEKSFFLKIYENVINNGLRIILNSTRLSIIQSILNYMANTGTNIIIYIVLGIMVLNKEISVGELVTMNMFAHQLKGIVVSLSSTFQNYMLASVSLERTKKYFESNIKNGEKDTNNAIEFLDYSMKYSKETPYIIKNFNYLFDSTGLYLIKGKNGCGKSTLLYSITQSLPEECIQTGEILHNKNLKISMVFQDPLSLSLSIRDNLSFGNTLNDDEIKAVLSIVKMTDAVFSLKKGLDSILGIDTDFSLGQLQRISIARTLLSRADILLLDEADSKLDEETKLCLIDILKDLKNTKLIIAVTHSSLFDMIADEILTL